MATFTLDNSKNQKAVQGVDNSLNYTDRQGNLKEMQLKSVATKVVTEAAQTASMKQGAVLISFADNEGNYNNYFVNKNPKNEAIILVPMETKDSPETFVYFNKFLEKDDKGNVKKSPNGNDLYYYSLNTNTQVGKDFENSLSVREWQDKNGMVRKNLNVRVTLSNSELINALKEKGENALAVVSKDGIRITTKEEHYKSKEILDSNVEATQKTEKVDIDR